MTTQTYTSTSLATEQVDKRQTLLRRALLGNMIFSTLSAGLFFFGSQSVAEFMGIADVMVFDIINGNSFILLLGLGLAIFAIDLLYMATRPTINTTMAGSIVGADLIWVAASWLLLITAAIPFSDAGNWAVLLVADVVLIFAIVQAVGIRRMTR